MKMTSLKQKSHFSQPVCWLSDSKNCEIQHKKTFSPTYGNLFAYAANTPVKYTDPDGNFDLPYMSPKDFFSFLFKYDSGAKTLKLYADAASGDKNAQALAKAVTIEAGKELAAED